MIRIEITIEKARRLRAVGADIELVNGRYYADESVVNQYEEWMDKLARRKGKI